MMTREEKKKWLETRKNRLLVNFQCAGEVTCTECPFKVHDGKSMCAVRDEENKSLFEEVWAKAHGYIKKSEIISTTPDKVLSLNDELPDPINPDHYKAGKMQVIEQMMALFGVKQTANFCKLNAYKYQARAGLKGDAVLDHEKADWYMRLYDKIVESPTQTMAMNLLKEFLEEEQKNAADH